MENDSARTVPLGLTFDEKAGYAKPSIVGAYADSSIETRRAALAAVQGQAGVLIGVEPQGAQVRRAGARAAPVGPVGENRTRKQSPRGGRL